MTFARVVFANVSFRAYVKTNRQGHEEFTCILPKPDPKHENVRFTVVTRMASQDIEVFVCPRIQIEQRQVKTKQPII
jgi:hypothetical protein